MIQYTRLKIVALFIVAALSPCVLMAQTSMDVPHTMSYQGQLSNSSNGQTMNGTHTISATLYTNAYGGHSIWHGEYSTEIANGVFTLLLGSGKSPLPEISMMNCPLWVGISVDGSAEMKPLTQLTSTPYALNVPDQSITYAKLAPEVALGMGGIKDPTPQAPTGFNELTTATNTSATMTVGSGSALATSGLGTITANQFSGILPIANGGTGVSTGAWDVGGNANGLVGKFGSTDAFDVSMVTGTGIVEQMRLLNSGGISIPTTLTSGVGVIWQNLTHTYIHSFGDISNFFAGNDAGNLALNTTTFPAIHNTGIGNQALLLLTKGSDNTAVGFQALSKNDGPWDGCLFCGNTNTAVGSQALAANTIGYDNTGVGYQALFSNTAIPFNGSGHTNTAVGACALQLNTIGCYNTAVGWAALDKNVSGSYNCAFGEDAMHENTIGQWNSAFGTVALQTSTGGFNSGFGGGAIGSNTIGNNNTACGAFALTTNSTGSGNTASGYGALHNNTTNANTADGDSALYNNTTGSGNTASGYRALYTNTVYGGNTAVGDSALYNNNSGLNTAIGYQALFATTSGGSNTASGYQALLSNTTGGSNTASGALALTHNDVGAQNTADGYQALDQNTSGASNTASGYEALFYNTTGTENTAYGAYALDGNGSYITGSDNTACGAEALWNNSSGYDNTATGYQALYSNNTGDDNTAGGYYSLHANTTGTYNTALGQRAGVANTTGTYNTFIGNAASASANNLTNASAIGNGAIVCASNTMMFGNADVTQWGFGVCPAAGHAIEVGTGAGNGNGAFLTQGGAWTSTSSKNRKERFQTLSGSEILSKILTLDVLGWYYKGTNEYHIGPFGEDFYSAFGTGNQDYPLESAKSISSIDPAGIALIGVKELKKENNESRSEITSLRKELEEIKTALKK